MCYQALTTQEHKSTVQALRRAVGSRSNLSHIAQRDFEPRVLREPNGCRRGERCSEGCVDTTTHFRGFVPERKKDTAGEDGVQYTLDAGSQEEDVMVDCIDMSVGRTERT
jgi:hypothetical protein